MLSSSTKLPIALSIGDPAGVGPEITAALVRARPQARLMIFGDWRAFGHDDQMALSTAMNEGRVAFDDIRSAVEIRPGHGDPGHATATKTWIERAVHAVKNGDARAVLTAPINKAMMVEGTDFPYPGHTEFLAALDDSQSPVMLITAEGVLRVVPATIHIPLEQVAHALSPQIVRDTVAVIDRDLTRYLGKRPRIAMAGLNPHAGEQGKIGREEVAWLNALAQELRAKGFDITDPLPADTMFHARAREQYDVALCMYHDQALIPVKTLAFDIGVNTTLGLSFLRASPDHGTAYDIAGRGIASASSMIAAYDLLDNWTRDHD